MQSRHRGNAGRRGVMNEHWCKEVAGREPFSDVRRVLSDLVAARMTDDLFDEYDEFASYYSAQLTIG